MNRRKILLTHISQSQLCSSLPSFLLSLPLPLSLLLRFVLVFGALIYLIKLMWNGFYQAAGELAKRTPDVLKDRKESVCLELRPSVAPLILFILSL